MYDARAQSRARSKHSPEAIGPHTLGGNPEDYLAALQHGARDSSAHILSVCAAAAADDAVRTSPPPPT